MGLIVIELGFPAHDGDVQNWRCNLKRGRASQLLSGPVRPFHGPPSGWQGNRLLDGMSFTHLHLFPCFPNSITPFSLNTPHSYISCPP